MNQSSRWMSSSASCTILSSRDPEPGADVTLCSVGAVMFSLGVEARRKDSQPDRFGRIERVLCKKRPVRSSDGRHRKSPLQQKRAADASLFFHNGQYTANRNRKSTFRSGEIRHQKRLDELFQLPIHDGLDIGDLGLRSMIIDHRIGLKYVAPDL